MLKKIDLLKNKFFRNDNSGKTQAFYNKKNPNLLGYMYTDVPYWILDKDEQKKNKNNIMIYPWLNTILKLGAHNEGKKQWINLLKKNYNSPNEAAEIWGFDKKKSAYNVTWKNLLRNQTKKAKSRKMTFWHSARF